MYNQRFGAGGISPQIQAMIAAQVAQQMAQQQQFVRPYVMSAGEADIIGASDIDPDAAALLAGLDATAVGLDDQQIAGEIISGEPDLVGADLLISGADYEVDAESGAVRPRRMPVRFMPRRPAARPARFNMAALARDVRMAKALQAQPVIADRPYTRTRTLPAPFDSGSEIAASGSATISLIPNAPYKAEYLVIPDDVASDFVITTLQFGRVNGLASAAEMPANTYAETAAAELNKFDVPAVPPGIPIQIGVRNTSGAARRFRGRFQGKILES